jgi:CBS-domain-containing membrane protein
MTTDLSTVTPTASIDRAISLMEQEEIHHLCVVDAHKLAGIVSDRDILISTGWMLGIERNGATKSGTNGRAVRKVSQIMPARSTSWKKLATYVKPQI